MVDKYEQLNNYIVQAIRNGTAPEKIKQALVLGGWPASFLDKYFEQFSNPIKKSVPDSNKTLLKTYEIISGGMPLSVSIYRQKGEYVPLYDVQHSSITKDTALILEKIREELKKRQSGNQSTSRLGKGGSGFG